MSGRVPELRDKTIYVGGDSCGNPGAVNKFRKMSRYINTQLRLSLSYKKVTKKGVYLLIKGNTPHVSIYSVIASR